VGSRLSESDKLLMEFLIRHRCRHLNNLEKDYNEFCVREGNYRKMINDPVTQEEDRKRRWRKK
jgi:hypothetical protein